MAIPIPAIVTGVVELARGWFDHKKAKTEKERQVELEQIGQLGDADTASANDMATSWKDEYLTVIFSIPLIVVFHASVWGDPEDIERVKSAFAAMTELPEWYMWAVTGIVAGTFGLRLVNKLKR